MPGAASIVLDQFPRNMFRGEARAFAADALARRGGAHAAAARLDRAAAGGAAAFAYLPFEHSESLDDQERRLRADEGRLARSCYDYALRHREIIERFGRFPHRNAILGRDEHAEEIEFLKRPGRLWLEASQFRQ